MEYTSQIYNAAHINREFTVPQLADYILKNKKEYNIDIIRRNMIKDVENIVITDKNTFIKIGSSGNEDRYRYLNDMTPKSKIDEYLNSIIKQIQNKSLDIQDYLKIIGQIHNEINSPFFRKENIENLKNKEKEFQLLSEAVNMKRLISFEYSPRFKRGTVEHRNEAPLRVVEFEGLWYLLTKKSKKYYKLRIKNISNIIIKEENYKESEKDSFNLKKWSNIWYNPNITPYSAVLRISKEILEYWKDKNILDINNNIKNIIEYKDNITYRVFITDSMEIIPTVKYWLPHVIIEEPKEIVKEFENDILDYIAQEK